MSFLAPLFLIAAAAGAIPVLLHMINRQRAKELPFGTLRFLQISVQKTRRRQRLHDVLLMVIRAAVLVLIAVGLAAPTIKSLPTFIGSGGNSAVAIILDNSASMGTIDDGRPRFETAEQAAAKILDRLADGDQVALFLTGGPPLPEQAHLDRTHQRVRQLLDAAEVSYERADLGATLQEARALLTDAEAGDRQIFVITDMQRFSWEGLSESQAAESNKADAAKIPVIVVDCNRAPRPNVAVTGVRLEAPVPVAELPLSAVVELYNSSTVPQKRRLELFVDGTQRATSPEIEIPAGATARHVFQFGFAGGGLHRGEARLSGEDGCPLDDRRRFAAWIDRGIPVAVVASRRHEIAYLDDSFYLRQALSAGPSGGDAADSTVRVTDLKASDLAAEPLSQYKIIVCVNIPAPSAEAAERLVQYVDGGGNLFWIAGDRIDPEAYNRVNAENGGRLFPGRLGEFREAVNTPNENGAARDSWHIAQLDKDYPAFDGLLEPASLYRSVLVYKHMELKEDSLNSFRVLARLDDGEPLLVERTSGRGRVLFFSAGLRPDWTNLPLRPIFLPLLLQTTFELSGVQNATREAIAGSALVLRFDGRLQPIALEVLPPTGETIRLKTSETASGQTFRYADTHTPGIYLVRPLEAGPSGTVAFSVNGDPEESQSAAIGRDDLERRLGETAVIFIDDPRDLAAALDRLRQGRGLWEAFLFAVLACLVFETFLSNRFSSRREGKTLDNPSFQANNTPA